MARNRTARISLSDLTPHGGHLLDSETLRVKGLAPQSLVLFYHSEQVWTHVPVNKLRRMVQVLRKRKGIHFFFDTASQKVVARWATGQLRLGLMAPLDSLSENLRDRNGNNRRYPVLATVKV